MKVGVQSDAGRTDPDPPRTKSGRARRGETFGPHVGPYLADVAAWNELGTSDIPARPFMREAADQYRPRFETLSRHLVGKVIDGTATAETVLKTVGEWFQGRVQAKLTAGPWAANAPATVRAKGSSKPLIDTGRLRQSIRWVRTKLGATS